MITAAAIHDMISRSGQTVTLTARNAGAYSPSTGAATITTAAQTGKGVILPLGAQERATGIMKDGGTTTLGNSCQCLLSAHGITAPAVDDTLTDAGGTAWSITEVSPLSPAGTVLFFDIRIRGAG